MTVDKLAVARRETEKLHKFLTDREWDCDELLSIFDDAQERLDAIVNETVESVLRKLENSYLEEADAWSKNEMTGASGTDIKISKRDQQKARTDSDKIRKAIERIEQ